MSVTLIMVDIFGRSVTQSLRGKQGPAGPPGGIKDLCAWFPKSTLKDFQKYEEIGCFLLNNISTDIEKEGKNIKTWISRSKTAKNLKAVSPSTTIDELPSGNAIEFQRNCYKSNFSLIDNRPGSGFIAVTFLTDSDETQTLAGKFSQRDRFHQNFEISVTSTDIFISGYSKKKPIDHPINHDCRKWTTFLLTYTTTPHRETHFEYMIDGNINKKGHFTLDSSRVSTNNLTLGCRQNNTRYFSGKIHALEIFFTKASRDPVPEEICLLISNYQIFKPFTESRESDFECNFEDI